MLRSRQLLSTVLGTVLLVVVAGPAFAGPYPHEETGTAGGGARPASVPTSSDPGLWTYLGYAVAALVVVALVVVAFTYLTRHAHHRVPHPA